MAVNQVLQIFDIKNVTGVSGPPSGFSKIWPDSATNNFKLQFSDGTIKKVLDNLEVDTDVFTLTTLSNSYENVSRLSLNIGSGLTSSGSVLSVTGLTAAAFDSTNTFTNGYVLSATSTGQFTWVPGNLSTGDINVIPKFITANTFGNSLITSSGSNVYIGTPPTFTSASFSVSGSARINKLHIGDNNLRYIEDNNGILVNTNTTLTINYDTSSTSSNILTFTPQSNTSLGSMSLVNGILTLGTTPSNFLTVGGSSNLVTSRFFGPLTTNNLISTGASISVATFSTLNVTTLGTFSNLTVGGFTVTTVNDITTSGGTINPLTETKSISAARHYHKYNDIISTTSSFSGLTLSFTNEFLTISPTFGASVSIISITGSAPGKQVLLRVNSNNLNLSRAYNTVGTNLVVCGTAFNGFVSVSGFTMTNTVGVFNSLGIGSGSVIFSGTNSFYIVSTVSSATTIRLASSGPTLSQSIGVVCSPIESTINVGEVFMIGGSNKTVTSLSSPITTSRGTFTYSFLVDSTNLRYYNLSLSKSNSFSISSPGFTISNYGYFISGISNNIYIYCRDNTSLDVIYSTPNQFN